MVIRRSTWVSAYVGVLVGCGQQVSTTSERDDMLGEQPDSSTGGTVDSSTGGTVDSSTGVGLSCDELSDAASARFRAVRGDGEQCQEDADCSRQFERASGECWGTCNPSIEFGSAAWEANGVLAMTSAQEFCGQFRAQGCEVLVPSCPPPSTNLPEVVIVCDGGQCIAE